MIEEVSLTDKSTRIRLPKIQGPTHTKTSAQMSTMTIVPSLPKTRQCQQGNSKELWLSDSDGMKWERRGVEADGERIEVSNAPGMISLS